MQTREDEVLTVDELATYLKNTKSTLYKLVQKGKIPGQKGGKHWRFKRDVIDEQLGSSETVGQDSPKPK